MSNRIVLSARCEVPQRTWIEQLHDKLAQNRIEVARLANYCDPLSLSRKAMLENDNREILSTINGYDAGATVAA